MFKYPFFTDTPPSLPTIRIALTLSDRPCPYRKTSPIYYLPRSNDRCMRCPIPRVAAFSLPHLQRTSHPRTPRNELSLCCLLEMLLHGSRPRGWLLVQRLSSRVSIIIALSPPPTPRDAHAHRTVWELVRSCPISVCCSIWYDAPERTVGYDQDLCARTHLLQSFCHACVARSSVRSSGNRLDRRTLAPSLKVPIFAQRHVLQPFSLSFLEHRWGLVLVILLPTFFRPGVLMPIVRAIIGGRPDSGRPPCSSFVFHPLIRVLLAGCTHTHTLKSHLLPCLHRPRCSLPPSVPLGCYNASHTS